MTDEPTAPSPDETSTDTSTDASTETGSDAPPETADVDAPLPEVDDSALERAKESIEDAKEAEGAVGASDDIPIFDEERAGQYSEDQDGAGGS